MVRGTQTVFKYKTIKGPLHKLPAIIKFFLLLPSSALCMFLPPLLLGAGITTAVIAAFLFRFSLREQLADLKPAFWYAAVMYALSLLSSIMENTVLNAAVFIPRPGFIETALRLALIMQLSAMLFRTTSSIEIRQSFVTLEKYIRLALKRLPLFGKLISPQPRFAQIVSVFLCFISEIFSIWADINLAWKARGGRQGLNKIKTTVFVLISLSFEKASVKARALEARS